MDSIIVERRRLMNPKFLLPAVIGILILLVVSIFVVLVVSSNQKPTNEYVSAGFELVPDPSKEISFGNFTLKVTLLNGCWSMRPVPPIKHVNGFSYPVEGGCVVNVSTLDVSTNHAKEINQTFTITAPNGDFYILKNTDKFIKSTYKVIFTRQLEVPLVPFN